MTDTTEQAGRWLLIGPAANALGVSERTLYRQISSGQRRAKRADRRVWVWLSDTDRGSPTDASDSKVAVVSDIDGVSDSQDGKAPDVSDMSVVAEAMGTAVAALERALAEERARAKAAELRASHAEQTAAMYQERVRNLEEDNRRLHAQLALPEPAPAPASPPGPVEVLRAEVEELRSRLEVPKAPWWAFWRRAGR